MVQPVISENWLNGVHNFPFTFLAILVAVSGYTGPRSKPVEGENSGRCYAAT